MIPQQRFIYCTNNTKIRIAYSNIPEVGDMRPSTESQMGLVGEIRSDVRLSDPNAPIPDILGIYSNRHRILTQRSNNVARTVCGPEPTLTFGKVREDNKTS